MREGCFCDEQLNQQEDLELPTLGNDNKSAYSLSGFQKSEYQTNEIELSKITSLPVHSVKEDENFKCSKGNKRMSTCVGMINVGFEDQNDNSEKDTNDKSVTVEDDSSRLIYKVSEKPPLQSSIFFAFQNMLLALPWNISTAILVAEVTCARDDQELKATLLSTTIFMSGLTTFVQVTFGVRMPVYQGPATGYIVPLVALTALDEWKCVYGADNSNTTHIDNSTHKNSSHNELTSHRADVILPRLRMMQGPLIVAGCLHALVGLTGTVGKLMTFIGPITIIPTVLLIILAIYEVFGDFCAIHWGISGITFSISLILCLYLAGRNIPILVWTRENGFHVIRYPLQQVLSMLITILIGWGVAGIFTMTGVITDDKTKLQYRARTDAMTHAIDTTPWFYVPYPGQFGKIDFDTGILVAFMPATFTCIVGSIGDYYVCARMARIPPPPVHTINRGIGIEGVMIAFSGTFGTGHGTTSLSSHIGAIGITRVASRFVFQLFAVFLIFSAIVGKVAAVFVTIPYPVLGGAQIISLGMFIGLIMSNMQYIDMQSSRNLAIIGISVIIGLMIPNWAKNNSRDLETGYKEIDGLIKTLLAHPNFTGGVLACFLDNTVPGTQKERGLTVRSTDSAKAKLEPDINFEEGPEVYDIPALTKRLENIKLFNYVPFLPTHGRYKKKKKTKNKPS